MHRARMQSWVDHTTHAPANKTRPRMPTARVAIGVLLAVMLALSATLPASTVGATVVPDDPRLGEQWGIDALHLPDAWDTATGDGIVIAIVDTGIDIDHPDLRKRIVDGYDFVDNDDTPRDDNGHGTHVAGIAAAAGNNGRGITGAAPDALIMPVRVLDTDGTGNERTIARGITWAAEHGADVINLSLGEVGFASRVIKGGPLNRAIRQAAGLGSLVVAASGNEGAAGRQFRIAVPVVLVGAIDDTGAAAEFSNFGDQRAVVAPGVDILSTAPTYPTTVWPDGTDGYEMLEGTSMAAPFVSGVAALLLSQGRSPADAAAALFDTAVNTDGDPHLGSGLVDASAAVSAPINTRSDDDSSDGGIPIAPIVAGGAALLLGASIFVLSRHRNSRKA